MHNIYDIKYRSILDLKQTQTAIKFVKDTFQNDLAKNLKLQRVSAPLFVLKSSGLNDNLNGVETPVSFRVNGIDDDIEIIHSLAKWKRMALKKYNFLPEAGLYTDMNAIRKDENIDFYHSLYVDQWDWELVIEEKERTLSYLKKVVRKIYHTIYKVEQKVSKKYPDLKQDLPTSIYFISTRQLEKKYPNLSRKEREEAICREHRAVFIYQIGWPLRDKLPHDGRAPDYDDWNLNGDLLLYYELYDMALEISSMGIRVDAESLKKQLAYKNSLDKLENSYCKQILNKELPFTIGGGIGQSRLSMFMLKKAHIGEVQVSLWNQEEVEKLKSHNIFLL